MDCIEHIIGAVLRAIYILRLLLAVLPKCE
jgi:hypothetical protein